MACDPILQIEGLLKNHLQVNNQLSFADRSEVEYKVLLSVVRLAVNHFLNLFLIQELYIYLWNSHQSCCSE